MKKFCLIITLFAGMMLLSCDKNSTSQTQENDSTAVAAQQENPQDEEFAQENEQVIAFLKDLYTPPMDEIFEEEWIFKHCSKKMQKKLRDAYDFDGEGWGSWIIGGWDDGEDFERDATDITAKGKDYFVTLEPHGDAKSYVKGKRVIRLTVNVENGIPVIDDCERVEDFKYE